MARASDRIKDSGCWSCGELAPVSFMQRDLQLDHRLASASAAGCVQALKLKGQVIR